MVHSEDRKGSKEIRVLKKVIKNLEVDNSSMTIIILLCLQEELLRERSKHQRYSAKKNQELRELIQEVTVIRPYFNLFMDNV